jgi:hypothetical protein
LVSLVYHSKQRRKKGHIKRVCFTFLIFLVSIHSYQRISVLAGSIKSNEGKQCRWVIDRVEEEIVSERAAGGGWGAN